MDSSAIVLLVGSAVISFVIGRLVSGWWAKRKQARIQALAAKAQRLREANPEPISLNKGKRKRQLKSR